jgi:hypothetical protein
MIRGTCSPSGKFSGGARACKHSMAYYSTDPDQLNDFGCGADCSCNSRTLSPLSGSQQDGVFYGQLGQAGERQREALAKRLQSTPVGRALAKMGAKISIEKPPPLHPLHWVRGQSGFELHCGRRPKTNVVFGLFDQQKKFLAWYLFSSIVDPKSQRECKKTGREPVVKTFGVDHGAATATPSFKNKIDVAELVSDAKSPFATIFLDTTISRNHITCTLKLNTKSNGLVRLVFGFRKVSEPSSANVAIPGKLSFLGVGPFDEGKFAPWAPFGPQGIAVMRAISNF